MDELKRRYEIRLARESDFGTVGDLLVRVYVGEGFSPPEAAESLRDIRRRASASEVIVAADEIGVSGAVFLVLSGPLRQIARADEAEVRTLAVELRCRGQGIAEALMRSCLQRAREARRSTVVLSTQPTMLAAHGLYEKLGFERAPARDWKRPNGSEMLAYTLRVVGRPRSQE